MLCPLAAPTYPYTGQVELEQYAEAPPGKARVCVYRDGQWGTLCSSKFTNDGAAGHSVAKSTCKVQRE